MVGQEGENTLENNHMEVRRERSFTKQKFGQLYELLNKDQVVQSLKLDH